MEAEPSFTVRTAGTYLHRGARISVQFPDGKGVAGILAGVDIAAGGTPFSLVITHDGDWPDDHVGIGGERLDARPETSAEAVQSDTRGDDPTDGERDLLTELGDRALQVAALRLRRKVVELSSRLARSERLCAEWEENSRNWEARAHALMKLAREPVFDETRNKLKSEGAVENHITINEAPLREKTRHRVMTWHESDGSVTIRVEEM